MVGEAGVSYSVCFLSINYNILRLTLQDHLFDRLTSYLINVNAVLNSVYVLFLSLSKEGTCSFSINYTTKPLNIQDKIFYPLHLLIVETIRVPTNFLHMSMSA